MKSCMNHNSPIYKVYHSFQGDWGPYREAVTGGSGSARVRGHVKSLYSAKEILKAFMSDES